MKDKTKKRQFSFTFLLLGILLAVYSVSLFIPLVWGFFTSLKEPAFEYYTNMFGLPEEWRFSNYLQVIRFFYIEVTIGQSKYLVYFLEMLKNSVFYALGSAFVQTAVLFAMAYVSARFSFKLGKVIYFIVILGMILPTVGTTASALHVAGMFNLRDSIAGMYIMKANFMGIYFLVFYETLKAFPKSFSDAANVDGAGNFTIMLRIMLPLSITTVFTVILLLFIQYWNEYTTPMLFMPNVPTLAYGLYSYNFESRINAINNTPMRLGACFMVAIPTLALFIAFHNSLMKNVAVGGVKE